MCSRSSSSWGFLEVDEDMPKPCGGKNASASAIGVGQIAPCVFRLETYALQYSISAKSANAATLRSNFDLRTFVITSVMT